MKDISQFTDIEKEYYNPVKSWAAIKLIVLDYFVGGAYVPILSRRFDKLYYVDLFAGSGIGKVIDNKGDLILGSSLLIGAYRSGFSHLFFIDRNSNFSRALEKRISLVKPKDQYTICNGDTNKLLDEIMPRQISDGHAMIFVDPYGMELSWESILKILTPKHADIIINFQTKDNARGITWKGKITNASKRFFGDEALLGQVYNAGDMSEYNLGERLLSFYVGRIKEARAQIDGIDDNTIVEQIRVRKDSTFYYDLLFIFRKTSSGNPWLKVITELKEAVEILKAEDIKNALDVLAGRSKRLAVEEEKPKKDERQRSLF